MTQAKRPEPVLLIMGLLHQPDFDLRPVMDRLQRNFGLLHHVCDPIPFTHSEYYDEEMGAGIVRRLAAFQTLIDPGRLAKIKLATNVIEDDFRDYRKKRQINIDPGYLNGAHLILASCKAFAHRPYLGFGVHADLRLFWKHGVFETLPWTYPDYADARVQEILTDYREEYMRQLRAAKGNKETL